MSESSPNGSTAISEAVDAVLAESHRPSPSDQPAAVLTEAAPTPPRLPLAVTQRLAELAAVATGAEEAAAAANDRARERRSKFEEAFTMAILSIGLPGGRNWRVNYNNGEVSELAMPPTTPTPILAGLPAS